MNVLFAHDHKFTRISDVFYSNGTFPSIIWRRYTSVFGHLTVVGRDGGENGADVNRSTRSSAEGVRFELLPDTSNLKSFLFGNETAERKVEELVRGHEAVIVRLPSRVGTLFVNEAIKHNKPFAIEVVGCQRDALWHHGSIKGKLYSFYAAKQVKAAVMKADFVIYVTKNFLQERYPSAQSALIDFCSNVEVPYVNERVLAKRLEKIVSATADSITVFGMIANYSCDYKGIDLAIKAIAETKVDCFELRVLGKGDPSRYINMAYKLGVGEKVKFVGSLPSGDAVLSWLDDIDIYLHPSRTEGLPRALIEAMSRGCPSLATNVGGIPELLPNECMIKVGDTDSLARKMTILAANKEMRAMMAEKNFLVARQYCKEDLDKKRLDFWKRFHDYIASGGRSE